MEKFIVTPKEDKSVTMTIRIDRALQEEYNDLAAKTNRSRNELISMAYMSDTVGVAAQSFVENTGVQLTALDMGWAPALGLCWSWKYAFVMFPVQIGINVIMLILGWTKTLNVDMWNVGNKIFTAFIVSSVTGSAAAGFVVAIAQIILELKNGDATKNQITELTGVPGVSMPHPMFLSNIFFYPFAKTAG
ncbi:MAG: PTS transporter subunit IIC [Dorea sp.]